MKPLIERLADELAWWINWAEDSESVPRRSFMVARRAGLALLRELDPRRVGEIGETGRSTSTPAPEPSTGPEDKTPVERPDSNKSGRSDVLPYDERDFYTLVVSELPACTTCNRVGHLAADCPNEGGSRGKA